MSKKDVGLYQKYKIKRTDGKPVSLAIVLEFHDPIARVGIYNWAREMMRQGYTQVYHDVMKELHIWKNEK